jgi:hypothetical protein
VEARALPGLQWYKASSNFEFLSLFSSATSHTALGRAYAVFGTDYVAQDVVQSAAAALRARCTPCLSPFSPAVAHLDVVT